MNTTLSIRRIVVPMDFSETASNALDTAIAMAKRHQAHITLLHVVDNTPFVVSGEGVMFPAYGSIGDLINHVLKSMDRLIKSKTEDDTDSAKISFSLRAEVGFVVSTIVRIAKEEEADIIVMGTHGASGWREFFIGSNAYSVIKDAPVPVLTVPSGRKWEYFRNILFPIRPIIGCLDKYEFVRRIIRKNNAEMYILGLAHIEGDEVHVVTDAVDYLKTSLEEDDVKHQIGFHVGDNFATAILDKAKEINTDLIVITASLDRTIKNFFIGPFAQQIVHHARFPVLSIKSAMNVAETYNDLAWLYGNVQIPQQGSASDGDKPVVPIIPPIVAL